VDRTPEVLGEIERLRGSAVDAAAVGAQSNGGFHDERVAIRERMERREVDPAMACSRQREPVKRAV
jgi:hypothetical protein